MAFAGGSTEALAAALVNVRIPLQMTDLFGVATDLSPGYVLSPREGSHVGCLPIIALCRQLTGSAMRWFHDIW